MNKTRIAWTDMTWNPVTGCTKVSAGCKNCYAEKVFPRPYPGRKFTDVQCHPDRLEQPLRIRKPKKIFVNSMSDLFHEDVIDFIPDVFAIMALAHWHTFQVLTKRPERMLEIINDDVFRDTVDACISMYLENPDRPPSLQWDSSARRTDDARATAPDVTDDKYWPLPNVWLGISAENQETFMQRMKIFKDVPAAVKFLSAEPLLGEIEMYKSGTTTTPAHDYLVYVDWVVTGGESGAFSKVRPCALEWIESIIKQCDNYRIPCFVKQLGYKVVSEYRTAPADMMSKPEKLKPEDYAPNGEVWAWVAGLQDRKGADPAEWPKEYQVQQFPGETL